IADVNNDLLPDIMVADMTAEDNRRQKLNMASMNPELFWQHINLGYHYQYMHNSLQYNYGNDENGIPIFGEISHLLGIPYTDWSWSVLLEDFDNDAWKDLLVTNGYLNLRDNDFHKKRIKKREELGRKLSNLEKIDLLNSEKVKNYAFQNIKGQRFENKSKDWGLDLNTFSNGASYADLDNDGDLDYIINNINEQAVIFENRANNLGPNYFLQIELKASESNKFGLGTKVYISTGGITQYKELMNTRGYLSSVPYRLHFGLGTNKIVDELKVIWPSGKSQSLLNIPADQLITLDEENAQFPKDDPPTSSKLFTELSEELMVPFIHQENEYDDFEKEVLLPHKMSNFGPALATGDLNGDQRDDIYVGGAHGQAGAIYLQLADGSFEKARENNSLLEDNKQFEDVAAEIFDINNDGKNDLYIVSGGNEHPFGSDLYQDRLYLNTRGGFKPVKLPPMPHPGSCVKAYDYDKDGDLDLFVGGRHKAQQYPFAGRSYLLENKEIKAGIPVFEEVSEKIAPGLAQLGMITDALWSDYDQDGDVDLMLVGEWMPLTIFEAKGGEFIPSSSGSFTSEKGWWFCIEEGDFDKDGDMDYLLGNLGLNYKYKASPEKPFSIYAGDLDKNGSSDIVLSYFNKEEQFPVRGLQCSSVQMPGIKKKFSTYGAFAVSPVSTVYGEEALAAALKYEATTFASVYVENKGKGKLEFKPLAFEAQFSSVNDILVHDIDKDGHLDAILGGNLYASEVETTRNDASIGLFLKGSGKGSFTPITYKQSGLHIGGDVKKLKILSGPNGYLMAVGNNNDKLQLIKLN
ncbi:MAG: FG-GAP-like repeat-containing protein, partial [Bacteroidota bacterium]